MAENSPSSSPPKPLQAPNCGVDRISPPNPQNPTLSSSAITPSLSSIDLPQVSSPQLVQSQIQITPSGTLDFPSKPPATSQQHSGIKSPTSNFQMQPALQRSGCISRINQIQQQFGPAIAGSAIRQVMYGGQMSFGGQQQQLGGAMTRPGMMNQAGQLSMLPSQAAAHFNIQSQMLVQPRQKTAMQGAQFHTANSSGQAMQGMQALAAMSPLASNSQLRSNGPLSYGQLRLTPTQLRQQLSQQAALTSPQKLSQSLQRGSSLAASSPQIPGLTQNGPSALGQGSISQQQWLKQIQSGMPSPVSPSYHIQQQQQRQQQAFLPQQLSSQLHQKSLGLSQQHISQLVQAQLRTTQHHPAQFLQQQQQKQLQLQQLQQLQQNHQQHQQQPSPKVLGSTVPKSSKGSQPGTSASGLNMPGEISSQGTKASNQLLGKRKIQDLVSQVDSSGRLDPEVEDLLLELADDFIDSVTTFACRLAKHRKPSTLESKDLLLHLEKNWHLTPGFLREEQKSQKVLAPIDVHKKRIELVRTLMESQERKRDAAIGKAAVKQGENNSAVDRLTKSSPSSEQAFVPAGSSHVVLKILRF